MWTICLFGGREVGPTHLLAARPVSPIPMTGHSLGPAGASRTISGAVRRCIASARRRLPPLLFFVRVVLWGRDFFRYETDAKAKYNEELVQKAGPVKQWCAEGKNNKVGPAVDGGRGTLLKKNPE